MPTQVIDDNAMIEFRIGSSWYLTPMDVVEAVVDPEEFREGDDHVYRERVIRVVDGRILLGGDSGIARARRGLVIRQGNEKFILLVDRIRGLVETEPRQLAPLPARIAEALPGSLIRKLAHRGDRLLVVLDLSGV